MYKSDNANILSKIINPVTNVFTIVSMHYTEFLWIFFSSAFLIFVNPFGFHDATKSISRDVFINSYSASYPKISSLNSDSISVVLFNETSLAPEGWPPKYSLYASTLRKILSYSPKAVMFDIALIDSRKDKSIKQLVEVFQEYHRMGIPVFFPILGKSSGTLSPARTELISLINTGKLLPVSVKLGELTGNVPSYPLLNDESGNLPAAVKITKELHPELRESIDIFKERKGAMEIFWRNPSDTFLCSVEEVYKCDSLTDNRFKRLLYLALEGAFSNYWNIKESSSYQQFRPFDTIYVNEMNEYNRENIDPQLNDTVVFVGTELALMRNYDESIVYGSLPSVYFHAMAYHNILTWKDDVFIRKNPLNITDNMHSFLIMMFILLVIYFVRYILFLLSYKKILMEKYKTGLNFFISIIITIMIILIEHFYFRISPINWLGIISIVVISPFFYKKISLR